jgi:2,3-oxidosqualene cyclase
MKRTFPAPDNAEASCGAEQALDWLARQQYESGCWEGEVVWCPMILAQYVIVQRILGRTIEERTRRGIVRHFEITRKHGAGWGLHPESEPYVFVTTLAYVALRLVGVSPDDPLVAPARAWLLSQPGGVLGIPTWGKFWLSILGLYEYSGMNPIPPELFLLPRWLPFHPNKLHCHTRYIYLAMAYLYGRRFHGPFTGEIERLRQELYTSPYGEIDFPAQRHRLAISDVYVRPNALLRMAFNFLNAVERLRPWIPGSKALRQRAIDRCADGILYEQRASRFQAISPVNGLLNTLALFDRGHPDLDPSLAGLESWRWEDGEEGVRFAGARSNAWDTGFAMQAALEHPPFADEQRESLRCAYQFLRDTQIVEDLDGWQEHARDRALGGWCFSDGQHRWPVSDCTAESLCAVLAAHELPGLIPESDRISSDRLQLAAEFILSRQNSDGGFGTYERRRAGRLLEMINPSEMFGQCMTERSYIECTCSAVKALARFRSHHPDWRRAEVQSSLQRACRFVRSRQRRDGAYAGFWGINFTYATFFVVEALYEMGAGPNDPVLARAAQWLIARQRPDGGWGEHFSSCLDGVYREHPQSQAVMTAWALLALLPVVGPQSDAVERGVQWLKAHQGADGAWAREAVNGVFFGSAMLEYSLYRVYFPAWALARHSRMDALAVNPKRQAYV